MLILLSALAMATLGAGPTGMVVGQVEVGPVSPVERPGDQAKKAAWYEALRIKVYIPGPQGAKFKSQMLRIAKTLEVDAHGRFHTELAPGHYELGVWSDKPMLHLPPRQPIDVVAGRTVRVRFEVDTGIR